MASIKFKQEGNVARLYDVYLASFATMRPGKPEETFAQQAREKLNSLGYPELAGLLEVTSEGIMNLTRKSVKLAVKTIAKHADWLANFLRENGVSGDTYKVEAEVPYNPSRHDGVFSWILEEENLNGVIRDYLTAYDNSEINRTRESLLVIARNNKVIPQRGRFIPVPVRWLKKAYRFGGIEREDFYIVRLEGEVDNVFRVAWNYVHIPENSTMDKSRYLMDYNDITSPQARYVWAQAPITIPADVYQDPLDVIPADETAVERRVEDAGGALEEGDYASSESDDPFVPVFPTPIELERENEAIENPRLYAGHLGVLRNDVPAVLIESFNIAFRNDLMKYMEDENLDDLTETYANGIEDMVKQELQMRAVNTVVIDWGHGDKDPGTRDRFYGTGLDERHFTDIIQRKLADKLRNRGFIVYPLRYTGAASARSRIRYYVNETNRIAVRHGRSRTIFISNHVNYAGRENSHPPRAYVYRNIASQPKSAMLGRYLLRYSVPFYQNNIMR